MLRIDTVQTIAGTQVYGDHELDHVYYAIPDQPRFRLDDGKPVFKFIKYRFPVDREDGKKGGGFCFFDVEFALDDAKIEEIKGELQGQVNKKFSDRGEQAPPVELGQISFTKGTSKLLLADMAGGPIIEKVAAAGTPSLFGKNISAFAIEFTPEGATIFEKALQGQGGVVQVVYDLYFPVKLPPLTARAWFSASEFYSFYQTIDTEWSFWGEDEYTETVREMMISSESMGVELDVNWPAGTNEDTAELTAQLRDSMWRSLESAVERKMIEAIAPVSEEGRKPPEDIEDVTRDITNTRISSFENTYTESSVIEYHLAPQGTLPNITSIEGVNWADYAVEVDANDPFFKQLNVAIQVNADFEKLPIHSIEVHLEYKEGATNEVGEYRFQTADEVQKFATYIENDKWDYSWWYEVNYEGASKTFKSDTMETNEKTLTVNVDDLGIFSLDVQAGDLNFDQVSSVQAALEYQAGSGEKVEEQFTFQKDKTSHSIQKVIFEPRTRPYRYKLNYFMADGKEFNVDWVEGRARQLYINDPFSASKVIGLRAAGNLETDIESIFVDLKYVDEPNQYEQATSVALSKDTPFFNWSFPVIASSTGKTTYSGQIRYRNGTVGEIPVTETTEATILVGDLIEDKLAVQVLADLVDFTSVKLVKVSLAYEDAANEIDETFDVIFRAGETAPVTWTVNLEDKTRNEYRWQATFFLADGTEKQTEWATSTAPTVVLETPGGAPPAGGSTPEPVGGGATPEPVAGGGTPAPAGGGTAPAPGGAPTPSGGPS